VTRSELVLTASEIGTYAFCPTAWHLQRLGTSRDPASVARMELGTLAHRRMARHAMRLRKVDVLRGLLVVVITALLIAVVLLQNSAGGPTGP
jgi:PD-(D/E)XK nuclease superfamily protein